MGNEQQPESDSSISPKIKNAIDSFTKTLNEIESTKEQRSLILEHKVPSEFANTFNLNQWINIAKYVLETDKIIATMRQKCVPSLIKEDEFWQKYFFIVSQEKKKKDKLKKKKKKLKKKTNNNNTDSKQADPPVETESKSDTTPSEESKDSKESESLSEEDDTYQLLLHKPIIWLYKIPATIWRGRNNKCELWGLRNPIWMGRLRIVAYNHGRHLEFQFLEKDGKLFLKSMRIPLDEINDENNPIHEYFDAYGVIDSSRYFIIWVDVPKQKTKKIPFGFGIRERLDAFDIRACVADQMKIVRRELFGGDNISVSSGDGSDTPVKGDIQTHKFELNDDEMISIGHNIDNIDHRIDIDTKNIQKHKHSTILKVDMKKVNAIGNDEAFLLPPPPSPPLTPTDELTHIDDLSHHINMHKKKEYNVSYNDNDFGEFQTPNDVDNDDDGDQDNQNNQNNQNNDQQ